MYIQYDSTLLDPLFATLILMIVCLAYVSPPETLVDFCHTTQRSIPEDITLHVPEESSHKHLFYRLCDPSPPSSAQVKSDGAGPPLPHKY